jgi:nucleoid-associated protein YgaU
MATKKTKITKVSPTKTESSVKVNRPAKKTSVLDRFQMDLNKERSYTNLVLGVLVVLVLGVLLFNFVSKQNFFGNNSGNLGPAQQTENTQNPQPGEDVAVGSLPGKYTVKEGDTLFNIAQKYYNDGYQYTKIAQENHMDDVNSISVGQVIDIPKIDQQVAAADTTSSPTPAANETSPTPAPSATSAPTDIPAPTPVAMQPDQNQSNPDNGQGGAVNQTIWGEKIDGTTYTVQSGDWLSKIAGRAYGDIMQYQKIAEANHITDPNLIEPGTVLQIPR